MIPKFLEGIVLYEREKPGCGATQKIDSREQVSVYRRGTVVKSEKFSEIIESAMKNRYLERDADQ